MKTYINSSILIPYLKEILITYQKRCSDHTINSIYNSIKSICLNF